MCVIKIKFVFSKIFVISLCLQLNHCGFSFNWVFVVVFLHYLPPIEISKIASHLECENIKKSANYLQQSC